MRALIEDIRKKGITDPIKVVEYNGQKYIVDGHHRYYAARRLGIDEVPIQHVELPYLGYKTPADFFDELIRMPGYWPHL
ncbi:ParB N-terminal domain-containing protein [Escherichia fergusonii]